MSRDGGVAGGGKKKRSEDAEESGFAGAVLRRAARWIYTVTEFERDILESGESRLFKWLEKGAPAGAGGRKEFGEGLKRNRGIGHREVIARPKERNNLADCGLKGVGMWQGSCRVTRGREKH